MAVLDGFLLTFLLEFLLEFLPAVFLSEAHAALAACLFEDSARFARSGPSHRHLRHRCAITCSRRAPPPARVRGWTRLSEATVARHAAPWCAKGDVFSQIVCESNEPELNADLGAGLEFEPFEAVVVLDIPEDCFRFDGTHTSVMQPPFTREQPPGFCAIGVTHVIDFYCTISYPPVA